jgi:hypothetical protein
MMYRENVWQDREQTEGRGESCYRKVIDRPSRTLIILNDSVPA